MRKEATILRKMDVLLCCEIHHNHRLAAESKRYLVLVKQIFTLAAAGLTLFISYYLMKKDGCAGGPVAIVSVYRISV
jgi:hypothetical protein